MSEENQFILSQDGLKLHFHQWIAEKTENVLCIVHGLGEHGGRYLHMAKELNQLNISVYALDLRGHGLSEGKRGHTPSYEHLLFDIEEVLKTARAEFNDAPLFLYGHSMGGNLVANYVKTKNTSELAGYILSSPFFDVAFQPPAWKVNLAKIMGSILPGLTQSNELNVQAISRIPSEVEKYENDPLVHDRISVGLFLTLIEQGINVRSNKTDPKISGLIYHGNADKLVSFDATMEYVNSNSNRLNWHPLDGVYHEPHNDEGRETIYKMIGSFITDQKS